ncbi:MAG: translation initiation factor IF-2 [Monoglobales bacterium]
MAKIKINVFAKAVELSGKELIQMLGEAGVEKKSTTSSLEENEMDLLFDVLTKKYDDGSEIIFEKTAPEVIPEDAVEETETEEKNESANTVARYVDTRANAVDLEKFEQESRIQDILPDIKQEEPVKKKIKKNKPVKDKREEPVKQTKPQKVKEEKINVLIPDEITVSELAERMKKPVTEIIKKLMLLGTMATVNDNLDFDTASLVAEDFGATVEREIIYTEEDILFNDVPDNEEDLVPRPPVVVVMGHVDHGKTSLLDYIRKSKITATEAGGITQHIGAYSVNVNERVITFLDTPGHEAFTAMRLRGAQVTDIAILVVAADDGIMPQTVEAINHAKAAGVTIIIAINKIDKPSANIDRVLQELTEYELVPEAWGGDTICVPVSALTGEGVDNLLEMVILVADMKELKANPNRRAKGTVIESRLDKAKGAVATVLVENGTLHTGDLIVAGTSMGKIRAMNDYKGKKVSQAGPSTPVEILGLDIAPEGGDTFYCVENEKMAKSVVEARKFNIKNEEQNSRKLVSLEDLFNQINEGEVKDLNIIVKADVQGSVEAVKQSLLKLSNDEVRINIIHGAVGAVNESDVMLADASNAIIVGFNVRPTNGAAQSAEDKKVDIRLYRIIYQAIEGIEAAIKGMLAPEFVEKIQGHAEIRQLFKVSGVGTIAGCHVLDGKITRNSQIRINRDGIVVHDGLLSSLKRFKDDAKEVAAGFECGLTIEKFNDLKEGDIVESYIMEKVERT